MKKALLTAIICTFAALQSCSSGKRSFATAMKGTETTNSTTEYTAAIREIADKGEFWNTLFTLVSNGSSKENVCISPLSAQLALSMAAAGATGETQEQMYSAMQLTGDINKSSKEIISSIAAPNEQCEVKIANSIWVNEKLDVKENFINTNKEYFDAVVENVPFNKATLERINSWCSEKTNGKIKSILDEIKRDQRMFLLNALYFKGGWRKEFNEGNTEDKPFTCKDGSVVNANMMHQTLRTSYYEDEVMQMASMPFKGSYQMLLILPSVETGDVELSKHLAGNFRNSLAQMTTCEVDLSMPRFKSEFSTSLKEPLKAMGAERAFSGKAQFDGISDTPLLIDNVIQKTYISVDEKGAEAAAVTAISMALTSMPRPVEKRVLNLNHPFLYIITDHAAENILFIGKIGNPNEK